jgi:hypothetical protein
VGSQAFGIEDLLPTSLDETPLRKTLLLRALTIRRLLQFKGRVLKVNSPNQHFQFMCVVCVEEPVENVFTDFPLLQISARVACVVTRF